MCSLWKKRSEATSGPQAFVSGHFYSMTSRAPSVRNNASLRRLTLSQARVRIYFIMLAGHNRLSFEGKSPHKESRAVLACRDLGCVRYLFKRGDVDHTTHSVSVPWKWVIYFLLGIVLSGVCQGFAVIISSLYS